MTPKQEIERLRAEIVRHDDLYYRQAKPEISDEEYDRLFSRLKTLESEHPEFVTPDSPTQRIGEVLTAGFEQVPHPFPLVSLDNTYDVDDLMEFHRRVTEGLEGKNPEYVCELKFDGVAIIARYEDGRLVQAATRGNGLVGDDITSSLRTVRNLPLRIYPRKKGTTVPATFFARGEVYITTSDFARINQERGAAGSSTYANPRNLAAGSLKLLDPKVVATRPLRVVFYGYDTSGKQAVGTQAEALNMIESLGLPQSPHWEVAKRIDDVISFWRRWQQAREDLPFEVDGIVVKVNSLSDQRILGMTARSPRWAVAAKFSARQAQTRLVSIQTQIGRTGILTPVAELEPVAVGGVTIRRATLHNFDEIDRLGVREGDIVVVERGGDVIPKIVSVNIDRRPSGSRRYHPPKLCPFCGAVLVREEGEVALRCPNPRDPEVVKRQIEHFASRDALDISGLGAETIDLLVDQGLVTDAGDLFSLRSSDIRKLDRFAEKSADNLIDGLQRAKEQSLDRIIFALGIRYVGQGTARTLAARFRSIDSLARASVEDLLQVPDVGERVAQSIVDFFRSDETRKIIKKLRKANFRLESGKEAVHGDALEGFTIVLTGSLASMSRDEAERAIVALGGKATSSVSRSTNYVVVGENPGSKLERARTLRIRTLSEDEFMSMIGRK